MTKMKNFIKDILLKSFSMTIVIGFVLHDTSVFADPQHRVEGIGEQASQNAKAQMNELHNYLNNLDLNLEKLELEFSKGLNVGSRAKAVSLGLAGVGLLSNAIALSQVNSKSVGGTAVLSGALLVAGVSQTMSSVANSMSMYQKSEITTDRALMKLLGAIDRLYLYESEASEAEVGTVVKVRTELEKLADGLIVSGQSLNSNAIDVTLFSVAQNLSTLSMILTSKVFGKSSKAFSGTLMVGAASNFAVLLASLDKAPAQMVVDHIKKTRAALTKISKTL